MTSLATPSRSRRLVPTAAAARAAASACATTRPATRIASIASSVLISTMVSAPIVGLGRANYYTGIRIVSMVRNPLTPGERRRGQQLGALLRQARGARSMAAVAAAAGLSAETLRKIETGPVLDVPLDLLAAAGAEDPAPVRPLSA